MQHVHKWFIDYQKAFEKPINEFILIFNYVDLDDKIHANLNSEQVLWPKTTINWNRAIVEQSYRQGS